MIFQVKDNPTGNTPVTEMPKINGIKRFLSVRVVNKHRINTTSKLNEAKHAIPPLCLHDTIK